MSPGDRLSKGLDFMLKGIGPKGKNQEARGGIGGSGMKNMFWQWQNRTLSTRQ